MGGDEADLRSDCLGICPNCLGRSFSVDLVYDPTWSALAYNRLATVEVVVPAY